MSVKAKVPIAETENCEIIIFRPKVKNNWSVNEKVVIFFDLRKSISAWVVKG